MKITAILPDTLIKDVQNYSHGKNITDSLKIALNEWISNRKIKSNVEQISKSPLKLNRKRFSKIRDISRNN